MEAAQRHQEALALQRADADRRCGDIFLLPFYSNKIKESIIFTFLFCDFSLVKFRKVFEISPYISQPEQSQTFCNFAQTAIFLLSNIFACHQFLEKNKFCIVFECIPFGLISQTHNRTHSKKDFSLFFLSRRFEAQVRSLTEKNTEVGAKAAELSEARVRLEAQLRCVKDPPREEILDEGRDESPVYPPVFGFECPEDTLECTETHHPLRRAQKFAPRGYHFRLATCRLASQQMVVSELENSGHIH